MLELRFVRENLDLVRHKCHLRGVDPQLIDQFTATDSRRLAVLAVVEALKNQRNTVSRTIASLKQTGETAGAEPLIVEMRAVSERIRELDTSLAEIEGELQEIVRSHMPGRLFI